MKNRSYTITADLEIPTGGAEGVLIAHLFVNGDQVASGRIDRTIPFFIGTEPADVGMDDLTPVCARSSIRPMLDDPKQIESSPRQQGRSASV